ncbi:MAG: sulfite exporter TauE/SafE family protein [Gemmatimonadetes bacterium]|nr:sulfite exporter TauE/SafE family protein [Gemmatimonadota bacterium]
MIDLVLLYGAGLVAGTLNVIAGGGSLLTIPVLIFVGVPPTVANGTNRIAILAQNVGATWAFHRRSLVEREWLRPALVPTLAGALVGAYLATEVSDEAFQRILAGVMVVAALWMLVRPPRAATGDEAASPSGARALVLSMAWFAVGVYGGFIQAGLGFVILALLSGAGLDLVRANAIKAALVLAYTPIALGLFALQGLVDLGLGLALALGTLTGSQIGVHLTVLKGQEWVRRVVVVAVVVFALRLWIAA